MKTKHAILTLAGLGLLVGAIYAGAAQHHGDMIFKRITAPIDPKKKKAGEE